MRRPLDQGEGTELPLEGMERQRGGELAKLLEREHGEAQRIGKGREGASRTLTLLRGSPYIQAFALVARAPEAGDGSQPFHFTECSR